MALAFEHMITGWLLGKVSEFKYRALTKLEWAFLLWGAIFPDIDFLVQWSGVANFHHTFTHSLFFLFLSGIVVYVAARFLKKKWTFFNPKTYALAIMVGILSHIVWDAFWQPGIHLLWPANIWFVMPQFFVPTTQPIMDITKTPGIVYHMIFDTGLGMAWLGYLFVKGRVEF